MPEGRAERDKLLVPIFQKIAFTCVLARFLPRALSVPIGVELGGSVVGTGSESVALDGPGSLMYGAVCS